MSPVLIDLNGAYAQGLRLNTDQGMIAQAKAQGFEDADRPYDAKEISFIDDLVAATAEHQSAELHDYTGWDTTAGGPGSGKSTDFLRFLCAREGIEITPEMWNEASLRGVVHALNEGQNRVRFISPDRRALLDIMDALGETTVTPELYAKWRPAANFLNLAQMESAFAHNFTIAHDTTLSSPHALGNLRAARAGGDQVRVRVYGAPMDQRAPGIDNRIANGFYQSWPANIKDQDAAFASNLPNIPEVADRIDFFWRDSWDEAPVHTARFEKGREPMIVHSNWQHFQALYGTGLQGFLANPVGRPAKPSQP